MLPQPEKSPHFWSKELQEEERSSAGDRRRRERRGNDPGGRCGRGNSGKVGNAGGSSCWFFSKRIQRSKNAPFLARPTLLPQVVPSGLIHHPQRFHHFSHPTNFLMHFLLRIYSCLQLIPAAGLCNPLHLLASLRLDPRSRHRRIFSSI